MDPVIFSWAVATVVLLILLTLAIRQAKFGGQHVRERDRVPVTREMEHVPAKPEAGVQVRPEPRPQAAPISQLLRELRLEQALHTEVAPAVGYTMPEPIPDAFGALVRSYPVALSEDRNG